MITPADRRAARTGYPRAPSRSRTVARRFLRSGQGRLGAALLCLVVLPALAGPLVCRWSPADLDFGAFLRPPSAAHWFGTTQTGGDVFALTMSGTRRSLAVGLLVAVLATAVAAVTGACAGYFLGWTDRVLMRVADLLLVLPAFLVLAVMSPLFGPGRWPLFVVMLTLFLWMVTGKVVRGMTRSLREREYIRAARYMGVPAGTIIFRHVLPNLASLLIVDATLNVSAAILTETSLSYFGFGVQPPEVSLGGLIADGARTALYAPWTFWFAAGTLVGTILSVNLAGDALRDAFDPGGRR
ncbi:ABC transporter permease [Sphaerisporangium rufum]|uniref:ABC transporter permease n=1 Tax=Sphaerisporangium rufum TaxID=1381558 RepID=A0A919R9M6_9ACTN|nr:ABC transporter permease [Sphaerisporangium rufum]GII79865.1 ABC transporter permease [Sphaerisporangium rufum]